MTEMNHEDMAAEIVRLTRDNEILKQTTTKAGKLSFKVAEKSKAVSVYGLGSFPVTLHESQWERLIEVIPALKEYIADASKKGLLATPAEVAAGKAAAKVRREEKKAADAAKA